MKQKNKFEQELKNYCISLKKFLIVYCDMDAYSLDNLKMSHKDIKQLIPKLKRISFDDVHKDLKKLYTGQTIIVKDSYGNLAPYACPKLIEKLKFELPEFKDEIFEDIESIITNENVSLYQLTLIRNKLKTCKKFKEYRVVNKLLKSKIDFKSKQYKKERKELIKERENNEY